MSTPPLPPPSEFSVVRRNSNTGQNDRLTAVRSSRLFCGYNQNENITAFTQNEWVRFTYPSSPGIITYRNNEFTVDPTIIRFTYVGTKAKWFDLTATCNCLKVSGGVAGPCITIQYQWRLNGVPAGPARQTSMAECCDAQIVCGSGELYLTPGDYIEPFIRNVENDDDVRLWNCSYNIKEDPEFSFTL